MAAVRANDMTADAVWRVSDEAVVRLALKVLDDPRAWAASGGIDPHGVIGRRVRRRAMALMAEALSTV